jgi:AraC-like DNA-binding protein
MPIVEIASSLGFADQSHLTNLFRRATGMTPGQVRTRFGQNRENRRNSSKDAAILQELDGPFPLLS